jgi:hypothetical protein
MVYRSFLFGAFVLLISALPERVTLPLGCVT